MFKLIDDLKFTHTVPVNVPAHEGHDEQTLEATYRVIGDDKLATYNMADTAQMKAMLREIVVSLDDIVGADDQPVPHSPELFEKMIDVPFVRLALVKGYYRGVYSTQLGN